MEMILGLIAVLVVVYIVIYNGIVSYAQKVEEAWSGISVQLKRRYDLIPNLVETVKGYATHEQETLQKVIVARSDAIAIPNEKVHEQAGAQELVSGSLKSLFALAESYPDLKANENFLALQSQLAETEDQISASRRIYNGNVSAYNTKIQSFPNNIVASLHGFPEKEFFETEEEEKNIILHLGNASL